METKKIIFNSLRELLEKNSFENITVQMILDQCHISRSTFYRHFEDKYALMNWYYQDMISQKIEEYETGNIETFHQVLLYIAFFMQENGSYFRKIADVQGTNSFWDYLKTYTISFYSDKVSFAGPVTGENRLEIHFFAAGLIEAVQIWIAEDFQGGPERIVHVMESQMPEAVRAGLIEFERMRQNDRNSLS